MSAKLVELEERVAKLEAAMLPKDAEPARKKSGRAKVKGAATEGSKAKEGADA